MSEKIFRIGYDAHFAARNQNQRIIYKEKQYMPAVSLCFIFSFFDRQGKEILFNEDSNPTYYTWFCVDKENGYKAFKTSQRISDDIDHIVFYPYDATIWTDYSTPITLPFEDGVQLLKDNFETFDTLDNIPAQNTCYCSLNPDEFQILVSKQKALKAEDISFFDAVEILKHENPTNPVLKEAHKIVIENQPFEVP